MGSFLSKNNNHQKKSFPRGNEIQFKRESQNSSMLKKQSESMENMKKLVDTLYQTIVQLECEVKDLKEKK